MLRIAICDDDILFTGMLEKLIREEALANGFDIEIDVFFDGSMLTKYVHLGNLFDLIFLDIEMSQENGIVAARHIRETDKTALLIYISGYEQYLKELFEVEPFRFLSKPLDTEKFSRYFKEAYERISDNNVYFQFNFNKEIKKVALKDVIYFESRNRIVFIYLKDGREEYFYGKLNFTESSMMWRKSWMETISVIFGYTSLIW
ncbi:MAG: Response regulator of the LytR/AlgR family [Lacrimispora sp.]|nr:Response regulator of the LytR/AlgR family [Lacrimispora sp.]